MEDYWRFIKNISCIAVTTFLCTRKGSQFVVSRAMAILVIRVLHEYELAQKQMKNHYEKAYADPEESRQSAELMTMFVQCH